MKAIEIRIELLRRGYTNVRVADELNLARSTVGDVLSGRQKSARVAKKVSSIVGIPVSVLWPGAYEAPARRRRAA